ncbi:hypothetical protein DBR42_00415 [Pelomonas sp. HMWF004]|nr:hypothetical protein DBR42_00415 [Pelomonas sp. HMWF004]
MPNMLTQMTRSRRAALPARTSTSPSARRAPAFVHAGLNANAAGQAFLALPFDALRLLYASAVVAGLAQRSILASGKLERALDALEKLILGPLARQR